jgi:hypothetical protein
MGSFARSSHHPTIDEPHSVPSMDPWGLVGETIANRYRVDGLIGLGGMGSVLRCHHIALGRDIAIKVLHPERNAQPESSARFTREARSASRLDHPNCVRVLDFGEWQPCADLPPAKYLAMELIDGQELSRIMREPLPLRTALEYAGQMLDGLDHAHARGIVHRDLKPENVIVTRIGTSVELLKLVDFGIAKIMGGEGVDARMTRTGRVFGTPQYMSPEQVAGTEVDGRTDLYAVGVLLYQMITGRLPFEGDDPTVIMGKHLFNEPPPLPLGMPPTLVAVVNRLLAKEPDARYQTARDAREDLDVAIRELDARRMPRKLRSRWLSRTITLGLALFVGVLGAVALPHHGDDEVAQASLGPTVPMAATMATWVHRPAVTANAAGDVGELQHLVVELLAAKERPLGYRERHRALAAIGGTRAAAGVDEVQMIALDLEQAGEAESPCLAFAAALAAIERDPAPVHLRTLRRVLPPHARAHDSGDTIALCNALPARFAEVRALVAREAGQPTKSSTRAPVKRARIAKSDRAAGDKPRPDRSSKRRSGVGRLRGLAG